MKKTSHTTHFHKRRKAIPGLTPETLIKEMQEAARGKAVRGVRGQDKAKRPVLPEAREAGTNPLGKAGIFGEPGGSGGEGTPVSNPPGDSQGEANFKTQLSRVLKRMLGEAAPPDPEDTCTVTNAEKLAIVVQREAFAGKQWACEFWRDMAEGKPVRAAQQNNSEQEIETQLDRVSLATLNRLAEKKG